MPLGKNADAGDYVKDFAKSKAPQFKGKSKAKRRQMAIAAYLDKRDSTKEERKMKTFDELRSSIKENLNEAYVDDVPSKAMSKGLDSRGSGGKGGLAKIHQHHADAAAAHDTASKTKRQDLGVVAAHKKAADSHRKASAALKAGNHQAAIDHGKKAREHAIAIHNSPHGGATSKAAHKATTMAVQHHSDEAKHTRDNHRDNEVAYSRMSTVQKIKHKVKKAFTKEGYASAAQRKAVHANKADGGKGHPDNKKEAKSADLKPEKYTDANGKVKIRMVPTTREDTSDAVKAFLAKGGKIKKLPPAKAQGYHGKDDPGADVHGLISKPDTKQIGTRKKVKSMEGVSESMLGMRDSEKLNGGKSLDPRHRSAASHIDYHHRQDGGHNLPGGDADRHRHKTAKKLGYKVEAKRTVVSDRPDRLASMRVSKDKPPFDNAVPAKKNVKDRFGNTIKLKNRAKNLARQAAKKATSEDVNELDQKTMNSYYGKAQRSKDRATNSAVATILRKGDHSKDLQTRNKRDKGMALAKSRTIKKMRGDK